MRKIRTLLLTLCVAGMLCGCGKTAVEADVSEESVVMADDEETVAEEMLSEEGAADLEEEPVENAEAVSESEKKETEASGNAVLEAWFEEQGFTEPTVVIWDTENETGIVAGIDEGIETKGAHTITSDGVVVKEYEFEEDDKLYLYYAVPIQETFCTYTIEFGNTYPTYCELLVASEDVVVCIMELVSEGTTYKHDFILNRVYE